jgi:hypothetical protein
MLPEIILADQRFGTLPGAIDLSACCLALPPGKSHRQEFSGIVVNRLIDFCN